MNSNTKGVVDSTPFALLLANPYLLQHFVNREVEASKKNSSSSYLSALSAAPFGRFSLLPS